MKALKVKIDDLNDDNEYLARVNDENAEVVNNLRAENQSLKEALSKVKKEKAGKSSAYWKLKRKLVDLEDDDDEDLFENDGGEYRRQTSQTSLSFSESEVEILEIKRDTENNFKNLDVFSGKELKADPMARKAYGESTCVRIPSSRTTWPNSKVSSRAVQARAASVKEFITLISGASRCISKEESDQVEAFLFSYLIKQNQNVFKKLLRTSSEVLSIVMKMSPEETSDFMHLSGSSYNGKRRMSTILGKIFQFNIFSSEKNQRDFEKSRKSLVERSKLDH